MANVNDQKKLGIIGGMGAEATVVLFNMIVERTKVSCDQDHIPTLIYSDSHMPDRTAAILSGDTDAPRQRLVADGKFLAESGCVCLAVPCNTAHYFAKDIEEAAGIPVHHMPRLTGKRIAENGKKKAAILATDGTVQSGIYHEALEAAGVEPWTPDEEIQKQIMSVIYDKIKAGDPGEKSDFDVIDATAREAGCDCAILGCTELSVFDAHHHLDKDFYIDPMAVLADNCVAFFGKQK